MPPLDVYLNTKFGKVHLELADPELISAYGNNAERFQIYFSAYLQEMKADLMCPEEFDSMICRINKNSSTSKAILIGKGLKEKLN